MATDMAAGDDAEPTILEEPGADRATGDGASDNVWMRGLWMVFFVVALWVARALVIVAGLVQFLWMLLGNGRNHYVAEFGEDLADWMARATLYVTAVTDDRPFPFDRWGIPD